MSALVDLVDVYRRRTEMLEAQIQMLANQNNVLNKQNETLRSLLVGQRLLRGRDVYTQTETVISYFIVLISRCNRPKMILFDGSNVVLLVNLAFRCLGSLNACILIHRTYGIV